MVALRRRPRLRCLAAALAVAAGGCAEPEAAPPSALSATVRVGAAPAALPSASVSADDAAPEPPPPATLDEQRARLFARMERELGLSAEQLGAVRAVFAGSAVLSQGNPATNQHPMTRTECRARRRAAGVVDRLHPECGGPFQVPLYPAGVTPGRAVAPGADGVAPTPAADGAAPTGAGSARVACIDAYEFPGLPCEYPVTWVNAGEAARLCRAVGKRLCDAHEWEGACAGEVLPAEAEYAFGEPRQQSQHLHNAKRAVRWAYGPAQDHARCATGSHKSRTCDVIGWSRCGSNTYPAGAFPDCVSPLGVYDQHGNAAEHMNLPTRREEQTTRGGLGHTEMKGSWFIFASYSAHDDDCRWRAPGWHATTIEDPVSHLNYHLGFRCCSPGDVAAAPGNPGDVAAPRPR